MLRTLSVAGGLAGALGLSQLPEFSQHYIQRLAGQVDALTVVAMDFDTSALGSGLGREEALQQMTGTPFLEARQEDMRRTFARHARLSDDLAQLRAASPLARLAMPQRLADPETLAATWQDFAPAVPVTSAGIVAAGVGFLSGWAAVAAVVAALSWPFRRKANGGSRRVHSGAPRRDPVVSRPPVLTQRPSYKPVMGETR